MCKTRPSGVDREVPIGLANLSVRANVRISLEDRNASLAMVTSDTDASQPASMPLCESSFELMLLDRNFSTFARSQWRSGAVEARTMMADL